MEGDRGGQYSRKRPHEDNRSYGYYEHREEKRLAEPKCSFLFFFFVMCSPTSTCLDICFLYCRSRTPQPPAEDEEENIDDTLVTIDTCK